MAGRAKPGTARRAPDDAPVFDPDLLAWADRARDDGDQPPPLFDVDTGPHRAVAPRTWPGGVQVVGPLLRFPGRTIHVDDLAEAVAHRDAVDEAITALRDEFGEQPC